jgi:DNA polymerase III delta subunit
MTPAPKRSGRAGILDFLAAPPEQMPSLIALVGKEHLFADAAIHAIIARAIPDESLRDLNVDSLDGSSVKNAGDIVSRVSALPFLAPRRVVLVRGTIDLKKDDRDEIVEACRDVPEHAVLVVDHSGRPARPQGRKPKDEAAAFTAGTRGAMLLECALDAAGAARFIDECVASLDVKIDPEARAILADTEDAAEIKNALDKLALTTKRIRVADIRDYAVSPQESKLWDLADAVNDRLTAKALGMAREFEDNAIGPLQWLAGDAQVIWELSTGTRPDEYARATGQNPWRIGKLTGAARKIAPGIARRNVDITMKALERCITGLREPVQTLEEVIVRLCEGVK